MSHGPERRAHTRVLTDLDADLETEEGLELRGRILNMSVRGFFLRTQEYAPIGSCCRVTLFPEGRSRPPVQAVGRIVREGTGGFGVEFEHLPYETFEVVRRIVLGAAPQPEVIEDELLDRLGIPPGE